MKVKSKLRSLNSALISVIIFMPCVVNATEEDGGNNLANTLFHHVKNSHELDLFPYFPPIHLCYGVTVHDLMLLLAAVLILALFISAFRKRKLKVTGVATALEAMVIFVRDDIVYPVMGKKHGEAWLPFFFTLFVFILTINYLGLIPAFKSATGNINVTGALAVMVFLIIFIAGFRSLGFFGFFKNMYPEGSPRPIGIFIVGVETLGYVIKSAVLSIRLFANMFAGHMVILCLIALIFIITPYFAIVSVPFAIFSFVLEILIALIQAFVFTLLSCVFINMAISSH